MVVDIVFEAVHRIHVHLEIGIGCVIAEHLSQLIKGFLRGGFKFLKVPNDVHEISVFHIDTLPVLGLFVLLDVFELHSKCKGVTHLVE